ncbi:hypothetical protein [Asaia prunellae]|nr:hypothetical protein [Asaia prunellae]
MSRPIAYVVGSGLATLHELETIYDTEDLLDLMEIGQVRDFNGG